DATKGELENQYNGLGFRVASTRPEEKIEYLCDLSRDYYNLLERTVNGEKESFIYDNNVISMSKSGSNYYYLQDELGSPMYMTGTDGVAVSSYAFDDFGRNIDPRTGKQRKHDYTTNGNIIQPFAFTGYQEDEVGGLLYANYRYYDEDKGRFTGYDLVPGFLEMPISLNSYLYCFNSPVSFVDLNGKWVHDTAHGREAHKKLQTYMKATHPLVVDTELYIPNVNGVPGNTGRADLVYYNIATATAEVYEIKPWMSAVGYEAANNQLDGYIVGMNASMYSPNGWKKYTALSSGKSSVMATRGLSLAAEINVLRIPSTEFKGYDIVYNMYTPGIITYNYVKHQEQEEPAVSTSTQCEEENAGEVGEALAVTAIGIGFLMLLDDIPSMGTGAVDDPAAFGMIAGGLQAVLP
ncbi:MAG: hypothetical protein K6E79_10385, partial [Pseudobutyrivibrio sp.]|nr:hypothetical protein [Pseudobutyrivibrio sp.]